MAVHVMKQVTNKMAKYIQQTILQYKLTQTILQYKLTQWTLQVKGTLELCKKIAFFAKFQMCNRAAYTMWGWGGGNAI